MRIAIFTDTYAPEINGVALTLERYVTHLEKQGIAYRLFVPSTKWPATTTEKIKQSTSIPFLLYSNCRLALPNPSYINHVLDDFKPTLIHVATPFSLGLAGLKYGKKHQIPMVASYHTHFDDYLDYYHLAALKKWAWKYVNWFHRSFEKIYVPSQSTKEKLLLKQFHQDIEVWGRGVNHDFYCPLKRSEDFFKRNYQIKENNILLYVGRVAPEKDIDIVLKTFYSLPETLKKDTHLVIVGDGPLYRSLSEAHNEQITWTGFIKGEELAQIYASSDLFLFPSPTETFGNVILEALASGLPVIGANAGGVQHLVLDGITGFLCEPRNIDQFVERTTSLLDNRLLHASFSIAARQFAETQSWDEIFDQLIDSFNEVLRQRELTLC